MSAMNTLRQNAKEHSVKVAGGSGVLIQPATDQYSYILTAKHVLMNCAEQGDCTDCCNCTKKDECKEPAYDKIIIETFSGKSIEPIGIFRSEQQDALILKIPFENNLSVSAFRGDVEYSAPISLFGYPAIERGKGEKTADEHRIHDLRKHDSQDEKLFFKNESDADFDHIKGFSGGGLFIFDIESQTVALVGVENRMDNADAYHGHICGSSIRVYSAIIKKHTLAELKPLHLMSFKHSKDSVFGPFDLYDEHSLDCVKQVLIGLLDETVIPSSLSPEMVLNDFSAELLAYKQDYKELEESRLWVWFLEFVAIQLVLVPPRVTESDWEKSYLQEVFNSYRFIYSNKTIGYRSVYRALILPTDFSALHGTCKIMLLASGDTPPKPRLDLERLNRSVSDVAAGKTTSDIATIRKNTNLKHDVIHWSQLNAKCLVDNEESFSSLNIIADKDQILALLTEKYGPYLL